LTTLGCVQHRDLLNLNEGPAFEDLPGEIQTGAALTIQPDDILAITVYSLDPKAAEPFNLRQLGPETGGENAGTARGYLVDAQGHIDFPVLGQIQLQGKTMPEAKAHITKLLTDYIKDPIVQLRFTNFRVTVLGEVTTPATFTLPDEQVSIFELLGMAGDLTAYGNRRNILVVREQNGQRTFGRINLQARDVFESPYFYLKQNDLIYIEPRKEVTATVRDPLTQVLPYVTIVTTLTTLVISILR